MSLRPCPFCGSLDLVLSPVIEGARAIACRACCCDGSITLDREEAGARWNGRYAAPQAPTEPAGGVIEHSDRMDEKP